MNALGPAVHSHKSLILTLTLTHKSLILTLTLTLP